MKRKRRQSQQKETLKLQHLWRHDAMMLWCYDAKKNMMLWCYDAKKKDMMLLCYDALKNDAMMLYWPQTGLYPAVQIQWSNFSPAATFCSDF